MFAIINNDIQLKNAKIVPLKKWFDRYTIGFNDKYFIVKNIKRQTPIENHLSKIEIGYIDNQLYDKTYYDNYINNTIKINDTLVLPFGVPNNNDQMHFYKSLLCCCYCGNFNGKLPNDEIVGTMMFALIQFAIFKLARFDIQLTYDEQIHYMKIVVSLFHSMRKFMTESEIFSKLVKSLADCVDAKDVIHREVANILNKRPLTGPLFQQILTLTFRRKLIRKIREHKVIEDINIYQYAGLNAIFTITPTLSKSSIYSIEEIRTLVHKINECKTSLLQKVNFNRNDLNFIVSGDVCHSLVSNMVNIIGIQVSIPPASWFANLFCDVKKQLLP